MSKTLVCRCEDVTLHELETAMQRGHRDVESVKRYTGFGTGWCQGKWCLALCARLIDERGGDASQPFTARPPYRPVRFADLAGLDDVGLSGKDGDAAQATSHGSGVQVVDGIEVRPSSEGADGGNKALETRSRRG